MYADLAKSGLEPGDVDATTDPLLYINPDIYEAGYVIPYRDLHGELIHRTIGPKTDSAMYRIKLDAKLGRHEAAKYLGPSGDWLANQGYPTNIPYIPPASFNMDSTTLYICEGEKKAASVAKHAELRTIGIGGCWNWRSGAAIHPWILDLLKLWGIEQVAIIPDGDVRKPDIRMAYAQLYHALRAHMGNVRMLVPPDSIDDLIVEQGVDTVWPQLEEWGIEDVPIGADQLVEFYDLTHRENRNGHITIHPNVENVCVLMQEHPVFESLWYNLDTEQIMYEGKPVTDAVVTQFSRIFNRLFHMHTVTSSAMLEGAAHVAKSRSRSPWKEYLQSLVWDGTERLDTWAIRLWGVPDSDYVRQVSSRWLVASVARAMDPGCVVDWMLVTIGPQGVGKTKLPDNFFTGHEDVKALMGLPQDKDMLMLIASSRVLVVDEMDSMLNSGRSADYWKTFITLRSDSYRAPYDKVVEKHPRRCLLYGTTNDPQFIHRDSSGYRRFAVLEVEQLLDWETLQGERDQLWAEAYARWRDGEEYSAAPEHVDINRHVMGDPFVDDVRDWTEDWAKGMTHTDTFGGQGYVKMSGGRIKWHVEQTGARAPNSPKLLGQAIRAAGWQKVHELGHGHKPSGKSYWYLKVKG
jgi:hypothetical protein